MKPELVRRFAWKSLLLCVLLSSLLSTAADLHVQSDRPYSTGTISHYPHLRILEPAPIGNAIQSTYRGTPAAIHELRRGFLEFHAPVFPGRLHKAWLILQEWRGVLGIPVPPVQHELSFYEADRAITTNDFNAPTTLLAAFETDDNEEPRQFAWDVTAALVALPGKQLGFRIKVVDAQTNSNGGGTAFLEHSPETATPRLVILTTTEAAPPSGSFIILQSSAAGQILSPQAHLTATAVDPNGYFSRIEFFANGIYIGASPFASYVSYPAGTPLSHELDWREILPGTYSVIAQGIDSLGHTVTSAPIEITVSSPEVPVVGTVTRTVGPGFSLIANPVVGNNNTIAGLFGSQPNLPSGFAVHWLEADTYGHVTFNTSLNIFQPADLASRPLPPGTGVWVYNPATEPVLLTFTGRILNSAATTHLPVGLSIAAPVLSGRGSPADFSFPAEPGDTIFFFNSSLQQFQSSTFDDIDMAWLPPLQALDPGTAFFVQKRRSSIWNQRPANHHLAGRAETTVLDLRIPDHTFEWYEYFGVKTLRRGDRVILKFSIIPSPSAHDTLVGLDSASGGTFFVMPFRDGTTHVGLPYRTNTWNDVVVTFDSGLAGSTVELNGRTAAVSLNSLPTSMQAFRLNVGAPQGTSATTWIDDVDLSVNGTRIFRVDFDSSKPRRRGQGAQGILLTRPKPASVP